MAMKTANWIFVTGTPRSGTTFVGKVLSLPLTVNYVHEPFNPYCGLEGIDRLYLYESTSKSHAAVRGDVIDRIFKHDFTFKTAYFKDDPHWKTILKRVVGPRSAWSRRFAKLNPFHKTMIIKDPIGCLLTEYLVEHYDVKPVIMFRHPAAVVASTLRLGWEMTLNPIREQQQLVQDYFADDLDFLSAPRNDAVEETAAAWRALNKVLLQQASRHPDWIVLRHDDLSRNPVEHFRTLYRTLGLPWTPRIERKVIRLTNRENPVAAPSGQVHQFKRNSAELLNHGLNSLSKEQREKIYEITRDVALQLYTEESFRLTEEQ
jgi:Sulfotransferase family